MVDAASIDGFLKNALRACRSGDDLPWPNEWPTEFQSETALTMIWSRIDYHGICVLLHAANAQFHDWPKELKSRIAEEARLAGLWEFTHGAALANLLEALDQAGIEAVLMKGTALAYSVYHEPSARRRGDSDLLIQPSKLEQARNIFSQCNWHRDAQIHGVNHQECWLHKSAAHFEHSVDLHWEPSDRAVLQSVLKPDDFFEHKRPLLRLCSNAWRADPALTIIHEVINQKWHEAHGYWTEHGHIRGARRLIWSLDFGLLTDELDQQDWERLKNLCNDRGIGPLVAEALRGAASDLGTQMPESHIVELESMELRAEIATFFATSDSLTEFWLNLRSASSWKERARMIRKRGLPPREYLLTKYPAQAGWPTLLLQGRLLLETAGRVLRKAVAK